MDKFKFTLLAAMTAVCISVSAGYAPTLVQNSLKKLYPNVVTVGWSTEDYFYVASFQDNGFNTKVWFDTKGRWVMKQTDWQTMDQVPTPVYHTFTFGPYSTDQVNDVTLVEFPKAPSQIVILISPPNSLTQYQLFYSSNGELINARNTSNLNDILGITTFY